jgi:hypothetical protein
MEQTSQTEGIAGVTRMTGGMIFRSKFPIRRFLFLGMFFIKKFLFMYSWAMSGGGDGGKPWARPQPPCSDLDQDLPCSGVFYQISKPLARKASRLRRRAAHFLSA